MWNLITSNQNHQSRDFQVTGNVPSFPVIFTREISLVTSGLLPKTIKPSEKCLPLMVGWFGLVVLG